VASGIDDGGDIATVTAGGAALWLVVVVVIFVYGLPRCGDTW
jgi:hypothetical protein